MINNIRAFWRKVTRSLFGKIKLQYKAILFIIVALVAGHFCDDYYQTSFPLFKICFGLVGLMMYSTLASLAQHDEEEE